MTAASFLQNMTKENTEKGLDMTEDRKTKKQERFLPTSNTYMASKKN